MTSIQISSRFPAVPGAETLSTDIVDGKPVALVTFDKRFAFGTHRFTVDEEGGLYSESACQMLGLHRHRRLTEKDLLLLKERTQRAADEMDPFLAEQYEQVRKMATTRLLADAASTAMIVMFIVSIIYSLSFIFVEKGMPGWGVTLVWFAFYQVFGPGAPSFHHEKLGGVWVGIAKSVAFVGEANREKMRFDLEQKMLSEAGPGWLVDDRLSDKLGMTVVLRSERRGDINQQTTAAPIKRIDRLPKGGPETVRERIDRQVSDLMPDTGTPKV